ncbi:cold-shock protein [Amphibacillus jilinensis]|uniref:cold-shock protein n=1 Tax=Amphibacillus jilinensis TaxID=1216008 RepID=UPI0002D8BD26|nr:cold-shock protein [Amphibacillus jilinensis]
MAYNNKQEPVEEVETKVWSCTNDSCPGWMRVDYAFDAKPECPLCQAKMIEEVRVLPKLS